MSNLAAGTQGQNQKCPSAIQNQQCTENALGGRGDFLKRVQYNVQPGAIISPKNYTTGPFSFSGDSVVATFPVESMQQCADVCARESSKPFGPYTGANAWTFRPDYSVATYGAGTTNGDVAEETREDEGRGGWGGTCSLGHVREPYYQTLTPHDNGAISGFALTSLSSEIHRFLFG